MELIRATVFVLLVKTTTGEQAASPCTDPACGDFVLTKADVLSSLKGFTTFDGSRLTVSSFQSYGSWWESNVGTNTTIDPGFCTKGTGARQIGDTIPFLGVAYSSGPAPGEITLTHYGYGTTQPSTSFMY